MTVNTSLTIDPDLQELIPPPEESELLRLEASLQRDGCLDALKAWRNGDERILLDGHTRLGLCQKLNLPYRVEVVESVTNRYEAIQWMIDLQLARRNLSPERQSYLRGRRYNEEKCEVGGQAGNGNASSEKQCAHSEHIVFRTAEKLAEIYGIGHATIRRDATYASAVDSLPPPERLEVLGGKSCKTKAEIVRDYLTKIGRCRNRAPAPPEKDYQILLKKALSAIDDLLATYSRDIRLEILENTLRHLHNTGHIAPDEIQQMFRTIMGESTHD